MKATKYTENINEIEGLIRVGKRRLARDRLVALVSSCSGLSEELKFTCAALSRRLGLPLQGVKLLYSLMHEPIPPRKEILTEFAACLAQVGAFAEAKRWLARKELHHFAPAILQRGFLGMLQWNYEEAVHELETYLQMVNPNSYEARVATVNLSAALTALDFHEKASSHLLSLIPVAREQEEVLLLSNASLVHAQALIGLGKLDEAANSLWCAVGTEEEEFSYETMVRKKWNLVLRLERGAPDIPALMALSATAATNGHYEISRDCDYYLAKALKDNELARKLYYGTPYRFLRKRYAQIISRTGEPVVVSLGRGSSPKAIDRNEFRWNEKQITKPGSILHLGFLALSSDLYRPLSLGEIFEQTYPELHFHPSAGPLAIHQVLFRLRILCQKLRIPLRIAERRQRYKLEELDGLSLIYSENRENPRDEWFLSKFSPGESFTVRKAQEVWQLERRMTQYYLRKFTASSQLQVLGEGRNRCYRKALQA